MSVGLTEPLGMDEVLRADADAVRRPLLVRDVDLGRREVADQHDGQRRTVARARAERVHPRTHALQHLVGDRFAVEDHAGT